MRHTKFEICKTTNLPLPKSLHLRKVNLVSKPSIQLSINVYVLYIIANYFIHNNKLFLFQEIEDFIK